MKKRLLLITTVVLTSLMLGGCKKEVLQTSYLDQGIQLFEEKKYTDALEALLKASEEAPNNSAIYLQIAEIYQIKGLYETAHESLEVGIANSEEKAELHFLQGDIYFAEKNYDEAVKSYSNAIKAGYSDDTPMFQRGLAYIKTGDLDKATEEFESVSLPAELKNKADYYLAVLTTDNVDDSLEYLADVEESEDEDFNTKVSILKTIFKEEKDKKAEGGMNEYYLMLLHGYGLLRVEEYEVAKTVIEPVATHYEEEGKPSYQANFYLGSIYYNLENYDKALEELSKSINSNPTDPTTLHLLGLTYAKKNDQVKSIENFEKSIKLYPNNENAIYDYIKVLKQFKIYSTAETQYGELIKLETDRQPQYRLEFAQFLNDLQGKPADAQKQTNILITEWSGFDNSTAETRAEIYDTHAWALHLQGDETGAMDNLELALAEDEFYASAYYHLGKVYEAKGNVEEAMNAYERAVDLALEKGLSVKANQEYERLSK